MTERFYVVDVRPCGVGIFREFRCPELVPCSEGMTQFGQRWPGVRGLISAMLGRKLLDLTLEYQASIDSRRDDYNSLPRGAQPIGREPEDIASEYETTIRALLS
ncbi:hypothetical protein [Gordonia sp. WA4-43]|uniref:hypothetical protein n=1 Tax=Gordonia sp. WA4-43 TaxID=2878678 RepID=UPI001CFBB42C|nr:hypothetical protein [Gordonia sp. WA4-43]UCZ89420.1 hypothetical protein LEL84_20685 [Gordonia sp. WA4-43]